MQIPYYIKKKKKNRGITLIWRDLCYTLYQMYNIFNFVVYIDHARIVSVLESNVDNRGITLVWQNCVKCYIKSVIYLILCGLFRKALDSLRL